MNKSKLLISSCLLCAVSNNTLAAMDIRGERTSFYERNKPQPIGFNYTYVEIGYIHSSIDLDDDGKNSVQSVNAKLSFKTTDHIAIFAELTGGAYSINNDFLASTELHVGAIYSQPVTDETDLYGQLSLINIDYDNPDTDESISASGHAFTLGLRQSIRPDIEWGLSASFYDIEKESYTKTRLSFTYGADNELQYIGGFETSDNEDKETTFTIGVRFNY